VAEIDSDGFDFRVADKGLIWSYPERRPGRRRLIQTDIAVLFVGDEAEKQALLLGEPEVFFTTPGYERAACIETRDTCRQQRNFPPSRPAHWRTAIAGAERPQGKDHKDYGALRQA